MTPMPKVPLPSGEQIPVLGQGTWRMGERRSERPREVTALQLGLDLGMTLIDTAEMYAEGGAEEVVGEAMASRRDEVFLVSKVYPHNASRTGTVQACERSLARLKTDRIDLYLLHWRGGARLEEMLAGMTDLMTAGKIRYWGVSNFDVADMEELRALEGGQGCATNQVLYNLRRRGIEGDLVPWSQSRGIPLMAYSPFDQSGLNSEALRTVATRHSCDTAQVALAWVLQQPGVFTIPKATNPDHVRANRAALELQFRQEDHAILDGDFPPPDGPQPLETA